MIRTTRITRNSFIRNARAVLCRLAEITLVTIAALCLTSVTDARADTQRLTLQRTRETIDIDAKGDAKITLEMKLPAANYTNLKRNSPNLAALLQALRWTPDWTVLENVHGTYDDGENTVRIEYTVRGLARASHDGRWETPLGEQFGLEEVAIHDNQAVYTASIQTDLGSSSMTLLINTPTGSHGLQTLAGPARLGFVPPSSVADAGTHPAVEFRLDAKPQVMSCLASVYANPKFSDMWLARVKFTNTGDKNVSDFRIRFRVADYAGWSDWQTVETVVPGQTVVEPYFPVFEVSKLIGLTGTRSATIETEYQYRLSGPTPEVHHESHRTDLLGRNQVIFSNMKAEDMLNFYDNLKNGPMILAAFVTHEDPVMQQVGGWVCGQAGGSKGCAAAPAIKTPWLSSSPCMNSWSPTRSPINRPPSARRTSNSASTSSMAATCCGIGPAPASIWRFVYLPQSHRLVAVESTMIGQATFEQAMERGTAEVQEVNNGKPAYIVNIKRMHDQGVACLELPSVPADVLAAWNIHRTDELNRANTQTQVANSGKPQTVPNNTTTNTSNNNNNGRAKTATPNSVIGAGITKALTERARSNSSP